MSCRSASGRTGERQRLPVRPISQPHPGGYFKSLPCFPPPSGRGILCDTVTLERDWRRVTEEIEKTNLRVCITAMTLFVALPIPGARGNCMARQ
jgi:hypothetical protein